MNIKLGASAKITQESGSNFSSSFCFLPQEKADALKVIYAYCRLTDDIVDDAKSSADAEEKLENWRKETAKSFQGKSEHPVLKELSAIVKKYCIPEEYFFQLIDGVQIDLKKISYSDFNELYPYCYGVASVVGLICLEVFGYKNNQTKEYAVQLGIAFQLTNILRDILTDAARGRVYIPEEDLTKFSLTREDFLSACNSNSSTVILSGAKNLIFYECHRAENFYNKAKEKLLPEDRQGLVAAEVMCAVYHAILEKIKKDPLSVFSQKIKLAKWELYIRVLQGWLSNRLRI